MPEERDWTRETLVLDLVNSLGETYLFEIEPGEKDKLPTRPADNSDKPDARIVKILIPLIVPNNTPQGA